MRTLKTGEAASLLNVSANTLRSWEERFGYPRPQRTEGSHRHYAYAEIAALREALRQGMTVSSAISLAKEALPADVAALVQALGSLKGSRAQASMEASLAIGSVDGAIEEMLLVALEEVARDKGSGSASLAFGVTWANDWLRRAQRLVASREPQVRLLIGDASDSTLDVDSSYLRALEFFCVRAGAEVASISIRATQGVAEAAGDLHPSAAVVAGSWSSENEIRGWIKSVRAAIGPRPIALYRSGRVSGALNGGIPALPNSPGRAQRQLFALIRTNGRARHRAFSR